MKKDLLNVKSQLKGDFASQNAAHYIMDLSYNFEKN